MTDAPFRITIVGAGIGGLACAIALRGPGRQITLVEKSRLLREVGAGISLQPNASRIVNKWGIAEELGKNGAFPDLGFAIYSSEGKQINKMPFKPEEDGAGRIIYHRIDLHNGLKSIATGTSLQGEPAKIILGNGVSSCDCEAGKVTLEDGTVIESDLIIGADGIRSVVRSAVLGKTIEPLPTGLSAYRIILDAKDLESIPELSTVMDIKEPYTTILLGHDKRVLMGPCRGGEILTIILLVPDEQMNEDSSNTSWTTEGNLDDVLKSFADFPEWIRRLIKLAPSLGLWQLRDIDPLSKWVNKRTIIVGDAAHAMLPLQGQGASQTFEDAEALAVAFADIHSKPSAEEVQSRLETVYKGRFDRASLIQGYSRAQAPKAMQSADGPKLNPMEFYKYNVDYHGFKDWTQKHPELGVQLA